MRKIADSLNIELGLRREAEKSFSLRPSRALIALLNGAELLTEQPAWIGLGAGADGPTDRLLHQSADEIFINIKHFLLLSQSGTVPEIINLKKKILSGFP